MSQEVPFYTIRQADGGVTVVTVNAPQIAGEAKAPFDELTGALTAAPGARRVVLSLAGVKSISSAAIALLINLQRKVRESRGKLSVCDVDPYVRNILTLTKVDQLLELRGDEAEAVAALAGKPRSGGGGSSRGGGGGGSQGSWFSKLFGGK